MTAPVHAAMAATCATGPAAQPLPVWDRPREGGGVRPPHGTWPEWRHQG
ncbi:hypothetical protein ACFWTE_19635 [Nocardiopsis sp. NPDC058631]